MTGNLLSNEVEKTRISPLIPAAVLRSVLPLNFIPLMHLLTVVGIPYLFATSPLLYVGFAAAILYLVPPLLARLILTARPPTFGNVALASPTFITWWALSQIQMIYCRFPFLEELIRIVPGAYSFWLRLWGARIGSFVYWSAGSRILDRSFLNIGDRVATGAAVRLNPHVFQRNEAGELILTLAPVNVGSDSLIGGYSLLTAGCTIPAGSVTPAYLLLPPFSEWSASGPGGRAKRMPRWSSHSREGAI